MRANASFHPAGFRPGVIALAAIDAVAPRPPEGGSRLAVTAVDGWHHILAACGKSAKDGERDEVSPKRGMRKYLVSDLLRPGGWSGMHNQSAIQQFNYSEFKLETILPV